MDTGTIIQDGLGSGQPGLTGTTVVWDTTNARRLSSDPQDILNARLGWTSEDEHFGIAVFARNLLDEKYPLFIFAQLAGEAFAAAPPRTYGLEVSMKF